MRAGISYALAEAMDEGHCGLPVEELAPLTEPAVLLVQQQQPLEARALVRLLYENLLWLAALKERGLDFVQDMRGETRASIGNRSPN